MWRDRIFNVWILLYRRQFKENITHLVDYIIIFHHFFSKEKLPFLMITSIFSISNQLELHLLLTKVTETTFIHQSFFFNGHPLLPHLLANLTMCLLREHSVSFHSTNVWTLASFHEAICHAHQGGQKMNFHWHSNVNTMESGNNFLNR